jgi:hypothetical protein
MIYVGREKENGSAIPIQETSYLLMELHGPQEFHMYQGLRALELMLRLAVIL